MSDVITVKDYRYPIIYIIQVTGYSLCSICAFLFLFYFESTDVPYISTVKFILLPFPFISFLLLLYVLKQTPVYYYFSDEEITIKYLLPIYKGKIIKVNQIDRILYSVSGGIFPAYKLVIQTEEGILIINTVTLRIFDQMRGYYSPSLFVFIPLERINKLLKNGGLGLQLFDPEKEKGVMIQRRSKFKSKKYKIIMISLLCIGVHVFIIFLILALFIEIQENQNVTLIFWIIAYIGALIMGGGIVMCILKWLNN